MKATKEEVKNRLSEKLTELNGKGFYKVIAERVGCTSNSVRQWFVIPERVSEEIENAAFMLYDELRIANEEKLKKLNS